MATFQEDQGGHPSRNAAGMANTTGGAHMMPNIETPQDAKLNRMQLVQYSVRAQQHILQQEHRRLNSLNNFPEELSAMGSADRTAIDVNASVDSTVASQAQTVEQSLMKASFGGNGKHKLDPLAPLQLPKISEGNKSPFKGFLDISIVAQKMRKGMVDKHPRGMLKANHSVKGSLDLSSMTKAEQTRFKKDNFFGGAEHGEPQNQPKQRGKSESGQRGARMNPMVLETWINETLQDAEHLDIPGCILKPDNAQPVSRYGINRSDLYDAGMDDETVNRIYRALFVYSVGFYELVKKCLAQTSKKYTIITKIWKVFSILLEYCCRTDYRMLISEISREHDAAMDALKQKYEATFQEQANNEKTLKQSLEMLQKYNDTLEKERQSERQMRLKLEEEYMQNTKNHEEEVQLRLKFESKLNNMHSAHRDLDTKYKRTQQDLVKALQEKDELNEEKQKLLDQNTQLKTENTKQESQLVSLSEKVTAQKRDLELNAKQKQELDIRNAQLMDELDNIKFKQQEQEKDMTANKLQAEMLASDNVALKSEKDKLWVELQETRKLQNVFEKKCAEQIEQLNKLKYEHQEAKKQNIGADELAREREERIQKLKGENEDLRQRLERLEIEYRTLKINHEQVTEQRDNWAKELEDRAEMLHSTNKVRHETEIKLAEEIERTRSLQDLVKLKDETLGKKAGELEDLDKKVLELERQVEGLQIKFEGEKKSAELIKKQAQEKQASLNEMLAAEKEARDGWIERYEKEQQQHTSTSAELLQAKSELKDQQLAFKNAEIKYNATQRQVEVLQAQNKKFQDQLNEATAQRESAARELSTQKEIMKQFEASKKEYIGKLKRELDTVEERFAKHVHQSQMIGEDYRSQAVLSFRGLLKTEMTLEDTKDSLEAATVALQEKGAQLDDVLRCVDADQMEKEDHVCQIFYKTEEIARLKAEAEEVAEQVKELADKEKSQRSEIEANLARIHELHGEVQSAKQAVQNKDKEIKGLEDELEELKMATEDQVQELKFQLAEAKGGAQPEKAAEPKASHKSLKSVKEVEVVKEVIKEVVKQVPTSDAGAQTEIGMAYFDRERERPMQHVESRGSNGSGGQSSKARVGGGGTIAKPPRQPSKHGSSSKQNIAEPLNVSGSQQQQSEGPRRSKQSAHSSHRNGEQPLPNLLTHNSRSNIQASRKSLAEQASQQQSEGRQSKKSSSHAAMQKQMSSKSQRSREQAEPAEVPTKDIQTLQSSQAPVPGEAPQDNSTAGGSMLNTLAPHAENTINTDHDRTISASGAQGVPHEGTIEAARGMDEQQVIPEEEDVQQATGSHFGTTAQTQMVDPSQHAPSQQQDVPTEPDRNSKKSSHHSKQKLPMEQVQQLQQQAAKTMTAQLEQPAQVPVQGQLTSKQTLSKQSSTHVKQNSGTSLNNPTAPMARFDGSPQRADTHPKNDSLQGSRNPSRQSRRSGAEIEPSQQQIYQNRMKVNINNQEMLSNEEQSYLGPPNQADAPNSLMQPQMVASNVATNQMGSGQPAPQQNPQQQLQQSIRQNNRQVSGPSTIRTLIKSAATR